MLVAGHFGGREECNGVKRGRSGWEGTEWQNRTPAWPYMDSLDLFLLFNSRTSKNSPIGQTGDITWH